MVKSNGGVHPSYRCCPYLRDSVEGFTVQVTGVGTYISLFYFPEDGHTLAEIKQKREIEVRKLQPPEEIEQSQVCVCYLALYMCIVFIFLAHESN